MLKWQDLTGKRVMTYACQKIRRASKQQRHGFIQEAVEPGSTSHTDGWEGYVGREAIG